MFRDDCKHDCPNLVAAREALRAKPKARWGLVPENGIGVALVAIAGLIASFVLIAWLIDPVTQHGFILRGLKATAVASTLAFLSAVRRKNE